MQAFPPAFAALLLGASVLGVIARVAADPTQKDEPHGHVLGDDVLGTQLHRLKRGP
jgi:hypothetical protein